MSDPGPNQALDAEALLDALFGQSDVGMTLVDPEFRFVRVNEVFGVFRDKDPADVVGKTIAEVVPGVAAQIVSATREVLETGRPVVNQEVGGKFAEGDRSFRSIRFPVFSDEGAVTAVASIVIDITDLRKAQIELDDALAAQRERDAAELAAKRDQVEKLASYRIIFDGASVGILRVDPAGRLVEANPAMEEMLGYSAAELGEMSFRQYTHPDDIDHNVALFSELIEGKRDTYQLEKRCYRKDGKLIWTQVTAAIERNPDGSPAFAISLFENITERKAVEAALLQQAELNEHQALHDDLTGLANRRKLYLDVEARLVAERPFALAIFDLDGFKAYNDTFGHPAGDELLVRLGNRLVEAIAGDAVAYRMGGDEFCIVGELGEADALVDQARAALWEEGEGFRIGCSGGVAHVPAEAATLKRALQIADERLYVDKRLAKPALVRAAGA